MVDDEQAIIAMEKRIPERFGYQVTSRTGSMEALEAFKADPDIPVLLCTGYNEDLTDGKAKTLGIKAVLMKPVMIRELAQTIRDVLDGNRDKIP